MRTYITQTAKSTPFDNTGSDFVSEDTEAAIKEAGAQVSPGFAFGRSGNNSSGTWLLVEGGVPSNRSGKTIFTSNAKIVSIYSNTRNLATYELTVYSHDGDEINLTALDTLTVTSSRSGIKMVDIPVAANKQLAVQVTSGSGQDMVVGVSIKGSI